MSEQNNKMVFQKTLKALFYPQVLICLILPTLISVSIWSIFLFLFWQNIFHFFTVTVLDGIFNFLNSILSFFQLQIADYVIANKEQLLFFLCVILVIALLLPLIVVTTSIVSSIIASTYLVQFIGKKEFPRLEKKGRSRWVGSSFNMLRYSFIYIILWLCIFPLIFILPLWMALSAVLTAWYNLKISRYDILTEWCNDQEFQSINQRKDRKAFLISLFSSMTIFLPLAFFFAGIIIQISLTYYFLEQLSHQRQASQ